MGSGRFGEMRRFLSENPAYRPSIARRKEREERTDEVQFNALGFGIIPDEQYGGVAYSPTGVRGEAELIYCHCCGTYGDDCRKEDFADLLEYIESHCG